MALAACLSHAQIFLHSDTLCNVVRNQRKLMLDTRLNVSSFQRLSTQQLSHGGGFRNTTRPNIDRLCLSKKRLRLEICPCLSQVASSAFTLGTAAVLPFYTLMVFAPKSEITKKAMESSIPYLVLGLVYAYLLYLSWTPETIRLMFSSQYWLPELAGIAKMFSSEMTLASAWIHLLVVDLFAARCIYQDGLANKIETRHSVSLCLLVCPIGIFMHTITKALTTTQVGTTKHNT